ncbi:MFS general substrate transporter [Fomitiporia mediterranea MF3/22]|uniref:MFS general substrate transporter n=1 Tax=Fomitiporia mediterranea (strain MF3/22) TaxID=694068 RepID=UPI0004407DB2|nr:MFS general substrate transporter [Fomitiporia mediterranea MF3/22]EJD04962.1 MFS general substrate transporter [Fomitiporia mediterranea MF3/22]
MAVSSQSEVQSLTNRPVVDEKGSSEKVSSFDEQSVGSRNRKPKLPVGWRILILVLTCLCSFGNHWSNGLIVALKTTIIKETHINNSQFATLVAVTNLVNTFLCVALGFCIDKWGGPLLSAILASFHMGGAIVMAGAATNNLNSYPLLIVGKVIAAIGDGSLDNAQHRIFSTYFARGGGFAFSIGAIWGVANLAQFTGQSTANIIATNLGTYAWALWISAVIAGFSVACALAVIFLDKWLCKTYEVTDQTDGQNLKSHTRKGVFSITAIRHLPLTFWIVVLFAIFENAGVQSFVSISTQFAQQRLKKGAVIGGWVSSFYLLLPACLTPFLGIFIDVYGQRVSFLFASGVTFLISMLLLKFSHTVPTFVAAYIFYAMSQCVTPAPQVEIVRSVISDPQWFATAFAIKKSVVQASIVIITTAAGKLQDDTPSDSLDPAVTLWLVYAFLSVAVSGVLLLLSRTTLLPAARLSQVQPRLLDDEVERLMRKKGLEKLASGDMKQEEKRLKSPVPGREGVRWLFLAASVGIIFIGWTMFGLGVGWGVHGNVIAGTTGE